MNRKMKALWILSSTVVGSIIFIFIYVPVFKDVSPQDFIKMITVQDFDIYKIISVLLIVSILSAGILSKLYPGLRILYRPLWGFKEQDGKFVDTSIQKHPVLIWILLGITLFAFIFIWTIRN